ncbi:MAG TPA: TIGR03086 family metal-binding protein [Acidimicrobiales bacterium]|nr:TIGR03086 family metal-binding protein [Acidimicrobiales bacterium]
MTAISDRYRRLAAGVTSTVEQVPPGKWSAQSPCEEWTALDVLRHLTQTPGIFFGMVGEPGPGVPPVEDDPVAAWKVARDATQAALDDSSIATREYDGFAGKATFENGVDQFICTDLIVHRWDIAKAAGLDDHIDEQDIADVREKMAPMAHLMRNPRAFGPEVEVPAEADEQTKFLAFLGRRA